MGSVIIRPTTVSPTTFFDPLVAIYCEMGCIEFNGLAAASSAVA